MKNYNLCVILDENALKEKSIINAAKEALRGGADIIQYRDKLSCDKEFIEKARALRSLTKKYGRVFIINDRVDAAAVVAADGVHIGQEDMPIQYARKIMGNKIIGVSAHSLKQAIRAEKSGADYIGIGPIFKTPNKPGTRPVGASTVKNVGKAVGIPSFAIGGINLENIPAVKKMGINRIAVISAATNTGNIYNSVSKLKCALER